MVLTSGSLRSSSYPDIVVLWFSFSFFLVFFFFSISTKVSTSQYGGTAAALICALVFLFLLRALMIYTSLLSRDFAGLRVVCAPLAPELVDIEVDIDINDGSCPIVVGTSSHGFIAQHFCSYSCRYP